MINERSYTEREYDYAVEIGVPVLGFVIDPQAVWPPNSVDNDPEIRDRLAAFKRKILSRQVSFWTNADSLNGKVLAALSKQKNLNPRPGWIRAVNIPGPEVLTEVARLSKEVARLGEENSALREQAGLEARFSLIDAMVDDVECQLLILMHEQGVDVPRYTKYVYRHREGGGGSGTFWPFLRAGRTA